MGGTIIKPSPKSSPEKVLAIEGASRPITKKQVRSFMRLVGFYRAFIVNFSQIVVPLMDLSKNVR